MQNKAIFLDRDGVVNVDVQYAHRPEQIRFVDGIFDFCRSAKAEGYLLVIVTNQAGIGRGLYSEDQFRNLMDWIFAQFEARGVSLDGFYFCPHHPVHGVGEYKKSCDCRKPKPGMILRAARHLDIDVSRSILIGDKQSDIDAAVAAGVAHAVLFEGQFPILKDVKG